MVIGPTPPGTGVIRWAMPCAPSKSTSPTSRDLPSGVWTRLMPTSMTVAPGLIQSPLTSAGRPIAATRMSAVRHSAARSRVREWAMVTVPVLRQQQLRHRLADQHRAPDHHGVQPVQRGQHLFQQQQAAERRTGHQPRQPGGEPPGIDHMQPVHVLLRIDRGDRRAGVEVFRQRQLHEDAVYRGVGVQRRHQRQQIRLRGLRRQPVFEGPHTRRQRLPPLVADIDLARRVLAHQHHRQAWLQAMLHVKPRHRLGDLAGQPRRVSLAVDDPGTDQTKFPDC